jgi:hypothetical protein
VEQREILWLAAQLRNFEDKIAFDNVIELGLKNGTVTKVVKEGEPPAYVGKDKNPIEFVPIKVSNFAALEDTEAFKQYQQMLAAYKARQQQQEPPAAESPKAETPPPRPAQKLLAAPKKT